MHIENGELMHECFPKHLRNAHGNRFGKSTHISISNSVTHLRSYNNTAIADIAGNSARAPISSHQMASVLVFRDVSQVFHDVLLCFTMFSESSNDWHC